MKQLTGWRGLGKALSILVAGASCLGSSFAQELTPRLMPAPSQQAGQEKRQQSITREVNLALDGTFRVAVVTRSGYYVEARLTFTRHPDGLAEGVRRAAAADQPFEPVRITTAPRGPTAVMGIKPGYYQVRIEVNEKTSQASLLVKAPPTDSSRVGQTQVLFPCPEDDIHDGDLSHIPEDELDPSHRHWGAAALGAGLATAIAVPLSLQHRERRRASP